MRAVESTAGRALRAAASDPFDADGLWRGRSRTADASLRGLDALGRLDAWIDAANHCLQSPAANVQGIGEAMLECAASIIRGDKDAEGRAIQIGRIIGLQPPSGLSATKRLALLRRDRLLIEAREAVPAWRAASAFVAAKEMAQSLRRYREGGWLADRHRETAPATAPAAIWWRLLRLNLDNSVPGAQRLAQILSSKVGKTGRSSG